jgi:hypothetical protein
MWPFRRRRGPDPAELLAHQARTLADAAERVSAEAAGLGAREQAIGDRERRLDERFEAEARILDERRDALALLGRELAEREVKIESLEGRIVELDHRDAELAEREVRIVAEELTARRRADELDGRRERLAGREQELNAREARLLAEELSLRRRLDELAERPVVSAGQRTAPPESGAEPERCVLFVPTVEGYRLVPLEVAPPRAGDRVELEGEAFDVLRVGPSPLPGDGRRCAFLAA